jgi:hypothetical protein
MDFQEAERRYTELKRQFDAGTISVDDFNAERQRLMVQDDEGRWWARSANDDEWNYYDGSAWIPSAPPGYSLEGEQPNRPPTASQVRPQRPTEQETHEQRGLGPFRIVSLAVGTFVILLVAFLAILLQSHSGASKAEVTTQSIVTTPSTATTTIVGGKTTFTPGGARMIESTTTKLIPK